eukprot:Tamp_11148.p1 GENE.Tamp_11148~~Tamp_11148.p1  ORF type:complete len:591 (+),score=74.93 Tamp_11148:81-1853(+)
MVRADGEEPGQEQPELWWDIVPVYDEVSDPSEGISSDEAPSPRPEARGKEHAESSASGSRCSGAPTCPGTPPAPAAQHSSAVAEPGASRGPFAQYEAALTEFKTANDAHAAACVAAAEAVARAAAAKTTAKKAVSSPDRRERARQFRAAIAPHVAEATRSECAAEEQLRQVLAAGQQADIARLKVSSATGRLTEEGCVLPVVQQVLASKEQEQEFLQRHPRWRQEILNGVVRNGVVEEQGEQAATAQVGIVHSGRGAVGNRRQGCCFGFQSKCNVEYSQRCSLVVVTHANGSLQSLSFELDPDQGATKRSIMLSGQADLAVKGSPNGTARLEMVLENGQYLWLWDVAPAMVNHVVGLFQSMKQMPPPRETSSTPCKPTNIVPSKTGHPLVPPLPLLPPNEVEGFHDTCAANRPATLPPQENCGPARLPSGSTCSTDSCAYSSLSSRSIDAPHTPRIPTSMDLSIVQESSPHGALIQTSPPPLITSQEPDVRSVLSASPRVQGWFQEQQGEKSTTGLSTVLGVSAAPSAPWPSWAARPVTPPLINTDMDPAKHTAPGSQYKPAVYAAYGRSGEKAQAHRVQFSNRRNRGFA